MRESQPVTPPIRHRKEILPAWIRFFSWIFLPLLVVPVIFAVTAMTGSMQIQLSFFGLEFEGSEITPQAAWLAILMTFAGVVSYGILWGRNWAIDAGIAYCTASFGTLLYAGLYDVNEEGNLHLQLEPVLLIPFLVLLILRRSRWLAYPNAG